MIEELNTWLKAAGVVTLACCGMAGAIWFAFNMPPGLTVAVILGVFTFIARIVFFD